MRHNVTWSHLVVPNVHLLVPKIAFEELLEEKYAHFGQFEDKISPTQTHPVFFGTSKCDQGSRIYDEKLQYKRNWLLDKVNATNSGSKCAIMSHGRI